jgi:hypothetical protein
MPRPADVHQYDRGGEDSHPSGMPASPQLRLGGGHLSTSVSYDEDPSPMRPAPELTRPVSASSSRERGQRIRQLRHL